MVRDAVRGYWALANGLTEITRQKAMAAAKAMVAQGEATAEQVGALAEEIIHQSARNREAVTNLVRLEIDRARSVVGLPSPDDVEALRRRVHELEVTVQELQRSATAQAPARKTPARKSQPRKAPARKTPAAKTAKTAKTAKKAVSRKTR